MKCAACGYSDVGDKILGHRHDRMPDGPSPFIMFHSGMREYMDREGNYSNMPNVLYACPVCGTIKMEV
jgi:hypothetical protein